MSDWLVVADWKGGFRVDADQRCERIESIDGTTVVAADRDPTELAHRLATADQATSPPGAVSGARWQHSGRVLELIRDQTGQRPLFYVRTAGAVLASTSARALIGTAPEAKSPSPEAVGAWLLDMPLAPEETLLRSLSRIPAGHVGIFTDRNSTLRLSWDPPTPGDRSPTEAERFGDALEVSVTESIGGDRRPAVFLSGGIDSGSVACALSAVSRDGIALCVDFSGASEASTQGIVASHLGLQRIDAAVEPSDDLVVRAASRTEASLWPTQAVWAPIFDGLAVEARELGAEVLCDGQGGDELLDAGYLAGRAVLRSPRATIDWLVAERRYTGGVLGSLRCLARPSARRDRPIPDYINPDLVAELRLREAQRTELLCYSQARRADLTDARLAAQREETFDWGKRHGLRHRHPLWGPDVVSLLGGLPPAALVAGGHPKAPARSYLQRRVPAIRGAWPQPKVADGLAHALDAALRRHFRREGIPELTALGVISRSIDANEVPNREIWRMLCLEHWLRGLRGWGD